MHFHALRKITFIFVLAFSENTMALDSNVVINGYRLSLAELVSLQGRLGTRVSPGKYIVNYQNGCWVNLSTGAKGCGVNSGSYISRYGSGERNNRGDWSHRSDIAGGSVGGTGDGCVYAFGWSNC